MSAPNEHELAVFAAIERAEEAIATVHERKACPTCSAPVGVRCRSMPRGYRPLDVGRGSRELVSPHKARLRADGIYER